jgi:hypothetical protein
MMEWWNIGKSKIPSLAGLFLKGNISLINSLVNRDITNKPLFPGPDLIHKVLVLISRYQHITPETAIYP